MNIKNLKPSSRYNQGIINSKTCKKLFPGLNTEKIIYRSSYELMFVRWLENCKNVKYWGSECFYIPYTYIDGKTHKYYPDYFVEMMDGTKYVIEIKPSTQTKRPVNENNWYNREYAKNACKWKAADEFCKARGFKFKIFTEHTIMRLK